MMNEYNIATHKAIKGWSKMVGAKDLSFDNVSNIISFKFKGCKKSNALSITYKSERDTYNIKFYRIRKLDLDIVKEFNDVHISEIENVVASYTGLMLYV
jgi:hypothetical protein